jgi:hypothetical protein
MSRFQVSWYEKPGAVDKLIKMWNDGVPTSEIANQLKVKPRVLLNKVHRLNLTPRENPIKKKLNNG